MRYRFAHSGGMPYDEELGPEPARRGRGRWWRRALEGVVALVVIAVAATGIDIKLSHGPAPLALPESIAAPSGPLDGTWQVAAGSVAGFRVRETVIGFTNDVTGRTDEVNGTVAVSGTEVSGTEVASATFTVDLDAIAVNGKTRQPQLVQSLGLTAHPVATIALTRPIALPAAFSTGTAITRTTAATLTLNGIARPVAVTLSARRDGTAIEVAGSLPVAFADFRISGPRGYGVLGSLADNGTAEFLLTLRSR